MDEVSSPVLCPTQACVSLGCHACGQGRPPLLSSADAYKEAAPQAAPAPSQPASAPSQLQLLPAAGACASSASEPSMLLYTAPATPLSSHPISAPPVCMPLYSWQMQREWAAQLRGRVPDEVDALMERGLESISSAAPAQPGSPAPGTPALPQVMSASSSVSQSHRPHCWLYECWPHVRMQGSRVNLHDGLACEDCDDSGC